ncbi:MAG: ATP-dependent RecD-like DNA helicase [Deltaproteobacteria bacterium]|nr:ATP-dependent RecD-like DNA helicase [Deltaproteobacteria bacterium]
MCARPIEGLLEGEVTHVTFESERTGFRVLRVKVDGRPEPETVVGVIPPAPPGARIRATGKRQDDPRHGRQFKAETLLVLAPSTLDGIERYLASGLVPGIGPAYAKRIVAAFGDTTLEVLDRSPARLREVSGLGKRRVDAIAKAWSEHRQIGAIMVFLQSHGASPSLAMRIYKRFGTKAMAVVSQSPYRLALDVWGVGFKTADQIARSIGIPVDSPERAQAGVLHALHQICERGHVLAERETLVGATSELLECSPDVVEQAIDVLFVQKRLVWDGEAIYSPELHSAETRTAKRLLELLGEPTQLREVDRAIADFERATNLVLDTTQRAAVAEAARSKVLVVTGGPGVGKTTLVRAILRLFDHARLRVALAAPTGRAAKRMSEATGRDAVTLHRLLGFDPKTGAFQANADAPLEADAVIVDETSMVPLELATSLLEALRTDARLVLVGDVDQLPSVGPGAVLRDVIESGRVPTIRLTRIFRQGEGSSIVANAHRIHEGEAPVGAQGRGEQFYVLDRRSPEEALDAVKELVTTRIPRGFQLDPIEDVQVLTPMQRGPMGAVALNELLQAELNPPREDQPELRRGTRVFRLGDKVMQLRNDYDREVWNGDVGRVDTIDVENQRLLVRFDERIVVYGDTDLDELTLAYATTIHKSQGSEYPCVIVPVLTQHFVMLSRNLIYTAVTRGKRLVVLVAHPHALSLALAEVRKERRRTRLAERLRGDLPTRR